MWNTFLLQVITRYEKEFGVRNYHFSAGVVEFVVVDAQTLDGEQTLSELFSKSHSNLIIFIFKLLHFLGVGFGGWGGWDLFPIQIK